MKITVTNAGKRFNRQWIFRNLNHDLESGQHYAITGHNGSGKSTLLQAIAGSIYLNEGTISYHHDQEPITPENQFKHIGICAPYLEVIEEMTAIEFLTYHANFKPLVQGFDQHNILDEIGLSQSKDKQIRYFSSGMKQRIKLAQAFFSDSSILLLDEPCTNLDEKGISLYSHLISTHCRNRLVIISSNDKLEYASCSKEIRMGV